MTYTTARRVRNIFGFSTKDIDSAALEELLPYVDNEIDLETGTTWDGTETYYPRIQEIAGILAGSLVYKRFRDQQQMSEDLRNEAMSKIKKLMETVDGIPFVAFDDPLV
jgi:hypothetical protein